MLNFLKKLFKDFYIFTASYSNNVFPNPLSKEEEALLLEKANLGNKEARNKLIEHNLRLVAHIVKKYDHQKEDADDLISIGTIGLIKGVDSYSFNHKTRLTTYCARCIENEILMYFRSNKKNSKNISIDESIGFDKEGNIIPKEMYDMLNANVRDIAMSYIVRPQWDRCILTAYGAEVHIEENVMNTIMPDFVNGNTAVMQVFLVKAAKNK